MKKYLILLLFTAAGWNCSSFDLTDSQDLITPELMQEYISFLASDELKGRNTPSKELDSAAAYIAGKFESFGLKKINDSYLQKIGIGYVSLGKYNHLKINKGNEEISFQLKDDFIPFENTGNKSVEAPLVFCGYGITAPQYNYDDYAGIDVKGKIVLVMKDKPGEKDSNSVFSSRRRSWYSRISHKYRNAVERGAIGVIMINSPLNNLLMKPVGYPWPSLYSTIPQNNLPLSMIDAKNKNIPVVHAGENFVTAVFGSIQKLKDLQTRIDSEMTGYSEEFNDFTVSLGTSIEVRDAPAYNVTAFLEGSDPVLKNEFLVIGAHYDHVGTKKDAEPGQDSIANGADDNASGTAGVLAIAKAFSELSQPPKRSILFLTFSGEEKGLFGSKYYVENPLIPLEQTVAMLNLDMIGRNDPDSMMIFGRDWNPELQEITDAENENIGFIILYPGERRPGGSDHAPFMMKGIPALFFNSGLHSDYHKVTDEAALIDFNKSARITQLAFRTAYRIVNESKRYKFSEITPQ